MALDYVVRDPRGISGMEFHIDGLVLSMLDSITHMKACGFTSQEAVRYMNRLIDEDKAKRGIRA